MPPLRVTLRNDVAELRRLAELVEAFGAQSGLPPPIVLNLTLALDELITNIITYAYRGGSGADEHEIEIRIEVQPGAVVAEVEDDGAPFDPLTDAAPPDLDAPLAERRVGGLGLHIVRAVMDTVEYARERGRNRLVLIKRLDA